MIPLSARDKYGRIKKGSIWKPERFCIVCGKSGVRAGRKYCSRKCMGIDRRGKSTWMKGKKHTKEAKEKSRQSHLGQRPSNYAKKMPQYSRKNHWNWQGGITKLNWAIRNSLEYKQWRRAVFERDDYTCQKCGKRGCGDIHAHHIISFGKLLRKYHIKTLEQAIECRELWDTDNGLTLCKKCHKKTDSYSKILRKR